MNLIRSHRDWELVHPQFLRQSQTWSMMGLQSLPFPSVTQVVWLEHLLVKTETKMLLNTSVFPMSSVTKTPISFQRGPTFPLVFLLSPVYL